MPLNVRLRIPRNQPEASQGSGESTSWNVQGDRMVGLVFGGSQTPFSSS